MGGICIAKVCRTPFPVWVSGYIRICFLKFVVEIRVEDNLFCSCMNIVCIIYRLQYWALSLQWGCFIFFTDFAQNPTSSCGDNRMLVLSNLPLLLRLPFCSSTTVGVSLRPSHWAVSSALPCLLNRAAAGGQLVTSSACIIEIMRGND